jgi:hypothetical protein
MHERAVRTTLEQRGQVKISPRGRVEMAEIGDRVCVGCGDSEENARLETCGMCRRLFCPDCAHRAGFGRKFCSPECGHAYYFAGDFDDDEDAEPDD